MDTSKTINNRELTEQFIKHEAALKSYLYRMTACREVAEDISQETFIRALDKLNTFKGRSTIKTWLFSIATHMALDHFRARKRWSLEDIDKVKDIPITKDIKIRFQTLVVESPHAKFEIKEHIDRCFTCIMKTLPIEQQIAFILKDVYQFKIQEITKIMRQSAGVVKHLLHDARKQMKGIYENRCSLINKEGVCHQCLTLNSYFNSNETLQERLSEIDMVNKSKKSDNHDELFSLRAKLVQAIDPINSKGAIIQNAIMEITREVTEKS